MAYYLIDFENVKSRGMEGVELLTEEDTDCIFYSVFPALLCLCLLRTSLA